MGGAAAPSKPTRSEQMSITPTQADEIVNKEFPSDEVLNKEREKSHH